MTINIDFKNFNSCKINLAKHLITIKVEKVLIIFNNYLICSILLGIRKGVNMKKVSAIILVILCVIALSSCASVGYEKAPAWLRGKTWTGFNTYDNGSESFTLDYSFTFYNDGTFRIEDYFEELPEGMNVTTSGNSNTYQISFVGPFELDGVVYNIEAAYTFTKVSNNECKLDLILKNGLNSNPYLESATLYAN